MIRLIHCVFLRLPPRIWFSHLLIRYEILFSLNRVQVRIAINLIRIHQPPSVIPGASRNAFLLFIRLLIIKRCIKWLDYFRFGVDLRYLVLILPNRVESIWVWSILILMIFLLNFFFAHCVNWSRQAISNSCDLLIVRINSRYLTWVECDILVQLWHLV
jgi:hypothetical protein